MKKNELKKIGLPALIGIGTFALSHYSQNKWLRTIMQDNPNVKAIAVPLGLAFMAASMTRRPDVKTAAYVGGAIAATGGMLGLAKMDGLKQDAWVVNLDGDERMSFPVDSPEGQAILQAYYGDNVPAIAGDDNEFYLPDTDTTAPILAGDNEYLQGYNNLPDEINDELNGDIVPLSGDEEPDSDSDDDELFGDDNLFDPED